MAKFVPGPNVETIRGKVGSIVYTAGKSGPFVRIRVKPKNPKTEFQETQRQYLRAFAKQWQSSTVNQAAWNSYALSHPVKNKISGGSWTRSGFQEFVSFNLMALEAGKTYGSAPLSPPSTPTAFPIMSAIAFGATTGPDSITLTPVLTGTLPIGLKIEVLATPQLTAGAFSPRGYKRIGVYDPILTPAVDITADYEARYSSLVNGQKIFCKARLVMPTGESDVYLQESIIVTPVA